MEGALGALTEASAIGWVGALAGALFGAFEWFILPRVVETSIRGSREARKLSADQLEGVISWWKTVIRVFAVSMPLVGFGLAAALAD
ncbi:Uncharacterised protein [Starkeya nomas]|uniref:DUF1772 domain-containing protein n=1 Tax=Starkeya nomas TaxID=2666134 RepID=A0A5S9NPV9_9HYPH|nr:hypothetical protein [Starkeya nomas]CAA0092362.1 Uncharacterised protein [Starkeya nomas]